MSDAAERSNRDGVSEYASPLSGRVYVTKTLLNQRFHSAVDAGQPSVTLTGYKQVDVTDVFRILGFTPLSSFSTAV